MRFTVPEERHEDATELVAKGESGSGGKSGDEQEPNWRARGAQA